MTGVYLNRLIASGDVKSSLWKMAIEIVDLPINSMVIFHSYVMLVYQRVANLIHI